MRSSTIPFATMALLAVSCSTGQEAPEPTEPLTPPTLSTSKTQAGGMVITDQMIGEQHGQMTLTTIAKDPEYGWSQSAPVMVGGGFGDGGKRTYRYLNSLRASNGAAIRYDRVGTCCEFDTPNSPFDGKGLLEVYEVTLPEGEAKRLYFNWYDEGELMVPVGLTSAGM